MFLKHPCAFRLRSFAISAFRIAVILMLFCTIQGSQIVSADPVLAQPEYTPWHCYDDGSLDPCHNTLNSVNFWNNTDGWAVGNAGKILRYQNSSWSISPSPVLSNLMAVQALSAEDAWAVGGDQTFFKTSPILHWNGAVWEVFPLSLQGIEGIYLNSLFMLNSNEGWAVGTAKADDPEYITLYDPFLLHWNGSQWLPVATDDFPPASSEGSSTIWASSANNIWIFSEYAMHWDGLTWTQVTVPGVIRFVSGIGPDDIWAAGYDEDYDPIILHWDGNAWTIQTTFDSLSLSAITMLSETRGWVMGSRWAADGEHQEIIALYWNGENWQEIPTTSKADLYSIAVLEGQDAWAVGQNGAILHWQEPEWHTVVEIEDKVLDLALMSSQDGWAVGYDGTIKRFNGQDWLNWPSPTTENLYFVEAHTPNDLWITGKEILLHWITDAQEWQIFSFETSEPLPQGSHLPNYGWDVIYNDEGDEETGLRLRFWNASTGKWDARDYPIPLYPGGFYMLSATDGWVVGYGTEDGTSTYHWDGESWTKVDYPDSGNDRPHLRGFAPNDIWVIGERTTHWDGSAWQRVEGESYHGLIDDLDKVGQDDYYAISFYGKNFIHWNAQDNEVFRFPTDCNLAAIDMLSTTEGWATGYGCPFVHYVSAQQDHLLFLPIVR